jgi:signal transduction histidine kinase
MDFFNTFRGRLLVVLALLLIATLGVQFYLNLRTQTENERLRELQEQTIVSGIALGVSGITSSEYMQDLIDKPGQTFLDTDARERIRDIIIINNKWQITDSLNPDLVPTTADDGSDVFRNLSEVTDLPLLMEGSRLGPDIEKFPNRKTSQNNSDDDEAHAVPIETSKGRYYIMVLLKNDKAAAAWRAAQPLAYTLGIVLASTLITLLLVWRFTRPVSNLSLAAREVASGNLNVRVPDDDRGDEIGQLAKNFNEMTAALEKNRELEDQLRQAEKSAVIGRLGSAIAHEIRNPLNYINLTLDHLKNRFSPQDGKTVEYSKLIGQVKNEVARINQQITDFLSYSRPAKANLQPIDARKTIEESLRLVEAQAAENDIKIGVVERESVPNIMADPEFLRSVFNNLFINAVQAMGSDGGNLNIKISPEEHSVKFEVSDTGPGIAEENLVKIFEPYFSTKETGTGLGLAIVQKILEMHNGSIEVESAMGEGTKFTVRIPAV